MDGLDLRMLFLIGAPRSGTTLLARMLGAHSQILDTPSEPHLLTPLAHLGYYATVDRAPYDHINAAQALREYVAQLPGGEADYVAACRAYCDVLYGRLLEARGARSDGGHKRYLLDKTPAYALVLPFVTRLYPRARYVLLARHPLAILSSYAESFFEGDYQAALAHNDVLGRYVPAMAAFLRSGAGQGPAPDDRTPGCHHLRYELLVKEPEARLSALCAFLELPFEPAMIEYGQRQRAAGSYGDPKVKQHHRPVTGSIAAWAAELAADPAKEAVARRVIEPLAPEDLALLGYDKARLFEPLEAARGAPPKPKDRRWKLDSYRLQRKVFLALRKDIAHRPHGKLLRRIKYYCDVLLRE